MQNQSGSGKITALHHHLKAKPDDGHAWMALARALMEQGPGPELQHAIGQCLRYLPDSDLAWILAAAAEQRSRGTDAAFRWLEHAARQNPDRAAPLLALARMRLNRVQLVEALDAVNRAIALAGGTAEALSTRGDINLQGAHWDAALADYRRVEKSGVSNANLVHQIGCCHFGLGDYEEAEARFEKALSLEPRQDKSRFFLALTYLKRAQAARAETTLAELAREAGSDVQVRRKATVALAALEEHRRLEPPLLYSLESGDVGRLQVALGQTPGLLLQRDPRTLDRFRRLAAIFSDYRFDPGFPAQPGNTETLAWQEAETLCDSDIDPVKLADLVYRQSDAGATNSPDHRDLLAAWHAVRDRAGFEAGQLQGANGEAWLRYWHARLLQGEPAAYPGQFKAVEAAIPGKPIINPEFAVLLCRALLGELLPSVPAGVARGLFLYVGLRVLQPFIDGNSRLARFLMNAELERSGLSPIVIPASWISRVNPAFDAVLFQGRLEPLVETLVEANADAGQQMRYLE